MAHTPGPWTVSELPRDRKACRWTIFSESDAEIALAITGRNTPEQAQANTRLITAAPELLDICERLYAKMKEGKSINPYEYRAALLQAITLAKGDNKQ
jgi:hypothetical protein